MKNQNYIILDELYDRIREGDCILFLGAAIHCSPPVNSKYSYPSEYQPPSTMELSQILAKKCRFCDKFPDEIYLNLQRVSLCFEMTHGLEREGLVECLIQQLTNGKMPSPVLEMLAKLPFKIFITTNYDCLLEKALRKNNKEPYVIVYKKSSDYPTDDPKIDPTPEHPLLFKIHGDIYQTESIVITDEDYMTFIRRMSTERESYHPIPETIRYRMRKWSTLFIGYSLQDYNLRLLFNTLRWNLDKAKIPPSFSVDHNPDPLILECYQEKKRFLTFVVEDLWEFIPKLYHTVIGEEFIQ